MSTRIFALASEHSDLPAVTTVRTDGSCTVTSWSQLADGIRAAAGDLLAAGVARGDLVAVALPKCAEHFMATYGAWHVGARPLMLDPAMAPTERVRIDELARPRLVVCEDAWAVDRPVPRLAVRRGLGWPDGTGDRPSLGEPPAVANFAIATGGSSGSPKVILSPFPGAFVDADVPPDHALTGRSKDMVQLVNGPLHHNSPCTLAYGGLLWGHHLICMERFDASLALDLIEQHQVSFIPTVPTVLKRLLDEYHRRPRSLASVRSVFHTGASCPPAVKDGWIGLIGAERVYEAFGGSELIGTTVIRGDEWLAHRGSVGRPVGSDVMIIGEDGRAVAPGTVGEIFMRSHRAGPSYSYVGEASRSVRPGGWESLGDLGWLSEDGYLYIADRRVDMIITGGENVYPAEVENVLLAYPGVADAVVVGVHDDDWGRRVHAIVQPSASTLSEDELLAHCRAHLSAFKVPKVVEFADAIPRDPESGKIRRSALVAEIEARPQSQKPRVDATRS